MDSQRGWSSGPTSSPPAILQRMRDARARVWKQSRTMKEQPMVIRTAHRPPDSLGIACVRAAAMGSKMVTNHSLSASQQQQGGYLSPSASLRQHTLAPPGFGRMLCPRPLLRACSQQSLQLLLKSQQTPGVSKSHMSQGIF